MSDANRGPAGRACPTCGKPVDPKHRPFCSARCQMLDLGRWLKGDYRIPTNEGPADAPGEESGDAES